MHAEQQPKVPTASCGGHIRSVHVVPAMVAETEDHQLTIICGSQQDETAGQKADADQS